MSKKLKAASLFREGYNCAQSVVLAFAEEMNMDEKTAAKLSSSFGGGMGRLREVCGAVSGMFLVAGMIKGYDCPDDDENKAEHYRLIQSLAEEFKAKIRQSYVGSFWICKKVLIILYPKKGRKAITLPAPVKSLLLMLLN